MIFLAKNTEFSGKPSIFAGKHKFPGKLAIFKENEHFRGKITIFGKNLHFSLHNSQFSAKIMNSEENH